MSALFVPSTEKTLPGSMPAPVLPHQLMESSLSMFFSRYSSLVVLRMGIVKGNVSLHMTFATGWWCWRFGWYCREKSIPFIIRSSHIPVTHQRVLLHRLGSCVFLALYPQMAAWDPFWTISVSPHPCFHLIPPSPSRKAYEFYVADWSWGGHIQKCPFMYRVHV